MRYPHLPACALFVLTATAPCPSLAAQSDSTAREVDPAKAEAIRTLLELTNTAQLMLMGFEEAAASQPVPPDLPEGFWEEFKAKVRAEAPRFLDMLVPVYDQYFSLEDVQGLIAFYRTPLGERFITVQPDLTKEMMRLGERWGMMLVGEVFMEFAKKSPQN
jgi:hypothetical protein